MNGDAPLLQAFGAATALIWVDELENIGALPLWLSFCVGAVLMFFIGKTIFRYFRSSEE